MLPLILAATLSASGDATYVFQGATVRLSAGCRTSLNTFAQGIVSFTPASALSLYCTRDGARCDVVDSVTLTDAQLVQAYDDSEGGVTITSYAANASVGTRRRTGPIDATDRSNLATHFSSCQSGVTVANAAAYSCVRVGTEWDCTPQYTKTASPATFRADLAAGLVVRFIEMVP